MIFSGTWSATDFFRSLTLKNRLAKAYGFTFCLVSGLSGFLDVISANNSDPFVIALDDTSDGYAQIDNSPHRRLVKTVYISMRHGVADQEARQQCLAIMAEIFRQFMSKLIMERTQLEQKMLRLDPRIQFSEMDKYFCAGSACVFFQIAVDVNTDMRFNNDEWDD